MNFFNKFNKLKNKSFKTNITKILSISIFALLLVISGTSYAYLTYGNKGTLINTVSSGNLELTLENETSTLSLNKAVPQLDDVALEENKEYTFTLKNTGNVLTHYEIYLNSICSIEETYTVNGSSIKPDVCVSDNYVKVGVKEGNNDYTILNFEENKVTLDMGEIWPDEEKNYTVKIWLDVNTPNDYNAYYEGEERNVLFTSKINVIGEQREYREKPLYLYEEVEKQKKEANISYKYINGANQTIDGIAYNVNDNGVFLYDGTDDNAGEYPIYYYRGNVTNNNVLFGGFCWKIVRTTSTGGTKLIYNGVPSDDGKCNNTGTASQLSRTSAFNTNYTSPADVGYMYGTRYTYSSKNMSSVTDTYKYGNDATYSNGTYTLTGKTMDSSSWSTDRTTLADGYHYTCGNSTGTCTTVYYITYFGNSTYMYYLTFTGGDNLDSAKTKMFTNTTDSTIKTYIDNWYSTNLTDYTNYLENTIFCNDRTSASDETYTVTRWSSSYTENGGALSSKDTNAVSNSYFKSFENTGKGTPSLECTNINDRFSLKVESGGTNGYGNNTLIYPVGLLTLDEAELAGGQYTSNSNYYLYSNSYYWLLSPARWYYNNSHVGLVSSGGGVGWNYVDDGFGVRPAVSLQLGTEFEEGTDGTANNPYVVKTS